MANQNFNNLMNRYNTPPQPVNQGSATIQSALNKYNPLAPVQFQKTNQTLSQPTQTQSGATYKGVAIDYGRNVDQQLRDIDSKTQIPQTITSSSMQQGRDVELPDLPNPPKDRISANADTKRTPTDPTIAEKPQTLKEQTQAFLQQQLAGGGAIDTSKERETLRINEKMKRATDLDNEIIATKQRYEDQIEELEKNPEGKLSGNLTQQVNKLRQEANKELADLSIQYKIANDDYVGAEKVLSDRIADMKDQRNYQLQVFNASINAIENDLTESEKLALAQQYRLEEIDYENALKSVETEGKNTILQARGESIAEAVKNGFTTIDKVSDEDLPYVYQALESEGYVAPDVASSLIQSKERLANIDNLLEEGTGLAVGSGLRRTTGAIAGFFKSGRTQEAQTLIDNLIANTALEVLPALKGPASDKDIAFIKEAASQLKTNLAPEDFEKNLRTFRSKITNALVNSIAVPFEEKRSLLQEQVLVDNPTWNNDKIDSTVEAQLNTLPSYLRPTSFNSAGNASASNLASAIKTVESGGNYQARGPVVTSGQYKGERALGAYQIMPGNLPSWSKEALGYVVSQDEFLRNPQIQDAIAQSRFANLLTKYSPEDASAIWFSGRPLSGNTSQDVTGTNTQQYVTRVINNLRA